MRKHPQAFPFLVVVFVILSFSFAAFCSGCGDEERQKAEKKLSQANEHLRSAGEEAEKSQNILKGMEALYSQPASPQLFAELKSLLLSAKKGMQKAYKELRLAEDVLLDVGKMKTSPEMKKYVGMKLDAIAEQRQMANCLIDSFSLRIELAEKGASGINLGAEEMTRYQKEIGEKEKEAVEHAEKAKSLHKEANAYYEKKNPEK
ncbi:MAG: hypothetical protein PHO53_05180 [Actinomycetota bacterium]|nr:hypothetical protein [Actinomycetota bacterium]